MALETASYVANLVDSNPDGLDQRSTADNHLRLIKAALKRTFPKMDGPMSLSSAQVMYLGDVSASVQLQLNQLRDGSATANNALYANSASYAARAGQAVSASFATLAATANSASYAARAGQAASASFATLAATANSASYAVLAGTAAFAQSASFATTAAHARSASFATVAATANSASYAAIAGNASALGGSTASESPVGSTVPVRSAAGHLYAAAFNMSLSQEGSTPIDIICTTGDGFLRRILPASVGAAIQARNITGRTGTAKTLAAGSGPPSLSGSTNGDLFYYY
jgi:hypothetical protein